MTEIPDDLDRQIRFLDAMFFGDGPSQSVEEETAEFYKQSMAVFESTALTRPALEKVAVYQGGYWTDYSADMKARMALAILDASSRFESDIGLAFFTFELPYILPFAGDSQQDLAQAVERMAQSDLPLLRAFAVDACIRVQEARPELSRTMGFDACLERLRLDKDPDVQREFQGF